MRKGRESLTAQAVAFARALASGTRRALIDPQDALAERVLPSPLAYAAHGLRALGDGELARALIEYASLGLVDHVALRSAMIDRLLEAALSEGLRQLVILGAGLDTRAHRLAALSQTRVYEIDHPDGQRAKRERARSLPIAARELHYVGVDLASGGLHERLAAAGHAAAAPTFWLAEGLVPYLSHAAIAETLAQVTAASAPASQLLVSYVTPELVWLRHARPLFLGALRWIGEPLETALDAGEVAALLQEAGFTLAHDSDTRDWARALCPGESRVPSVRYERLALGRR